MFKIGHLLSCDSLLGILGHHSCILNIIGISLNLTITFKANCWSISDYWDIIVF